MNSKRAWRAMAGVVWAGVTLAGAAGCNLFGRDEPRPLTADAFVSRRVEGRVDPEPIDRPGQVIVGGVRPPAEDAGTAPGGRGAAGANEISPAVRQSVRAPGDAAGRTAATAGPPRATTTGTTATPPPRTSARVATGNAAAASPGAVTGPVDPSGQYVIFGTVLAKVNTRPIYAHKLLGILDNALRTEAQQYPPEQFRPVATKLIGDELKNQVRAELIFAVAEEALDDREKQGAQAITAQWKNEQITRAGGSEELARRRWAEEGWDFDERLDFQYRVVMTQLFLQRRVYPQVQVTATDIRRYYEANKDAEYTQPARAKFRVVKIDPRQLKLPGGREEAKRLAGQIRAKAAAAAGGNFEAVAREVNDPTLKATGGLVGNEDGWLPKGTYVAEKLEEAVWALQPGQVTDVIEDRGAFYVAKLEERQDSVAREFEDAEVQEKIKDKLEAQQLRELQERFQEKLVREAVIQEHPQMIQVALDMAMQRYEGWTGRGAK